MLDIECVREMCCSLQQQQQKISQTYEELINTLNLQDQISALKDEVERMKGELAEKNREVETLRNAVAERDSELSKYRKMLGDKDRELLESKEELEKVKQVGSLIISSHNHQFMNILNNIDHLSYFLDYYFNQEGGSEFDGDFGEESRQFVEKKNRARSEGKSSLELLVEINNKFVKVTVNVMKLLSRLDHKVFSNYTLDWPDQAGVSNTVLVENQVAPVVKNPGPKAVRNGMVVLRDGGGRRIVTNFRPQFGRQFYSIPLNKKHSCNMVYRNTRDFGKVIRAEDLCLDLSKIRNFGDEQKAQEEVNPQMSLERESAHDKYSEDDTPKF